MLEKSSSKTAIQESAHFANRTKAKTALIETALTGDSLF